MNTTPPSPFTATTLDDGAYTVTYPGFLGCPIIEAVTVQAGHVTTHTHTEGECSTVYAPEFVALYARRVAAHIEAAKKGTPSYTGFTFTPAGALGKARASRLHRVLSGLGLGNADHYRAASAVLGRTVDSLAAITEQEARRVWNHVRRVRLAYELSAA
ncbi:hypothetical protein [Deinococcus ruber]|uniref:Uncharacterized protein n=1 Tax=Deinococcus ruber TaxID=1848197 RepID=A0A918CLM2_9DEIO|nr:hypothetical protein [Deinococcus ruber]GGR27772.1 hypothetical protein GCM10008957_43760 [Deinococcus ruber]